MKEVQRDLALDFIKIVCTVLILFHHYQQCYEINFQNGVNFFGGRFNYAIIVDLFFIISGLVTVRYINRIKNQEINFGSFIKHKFLNYIPLLTITAICYEILLKLYNVVIGVQWLGQVPDVWGTIITSLGIHTGWVFINPMVNNPTWYISVLLLCYVVFYICLFISKRLNIKHEYLFVLVVLMGLGAKTYGINTMFLNNYSAIGYYTFFTGLLLGELLENKKPSKWILLLCVAITVTIPLLVIYKNNLISPNIDLILVFIYFPSVIVTFKYTIINKCFKSEKISLIAKLSYNAFMWHLCTFMLVRIILQLFGASVEILNSYLAMIAVTCICYLVGTISYRLIDEPIRKLIHKKK